jgi:predicted 3-demethylubiquinone-9 3-methyltransferase (glyoxalase superfamily)
MRKVETLWTPGRSPPFLWFDQQAKAATGFYVADQRARVTGAFLKMKKCDSAALKRASEGKG